MLSELAEDGQSRNNYSFNAEMTFYQAGNKVNSLSSNGVEVDYADDGSNESQTLKFTWYIDKNGDIYIRYNDSGATYVMDAGAKQYGFYLDLRKYGSTHHSGFGLGFERCVMYLTGMSNIRDVIPFPRTVNNCDL